MGKTKIEGLGQQQIAGQGEGGGVQKIERDVFFVLDQRVAELEAMLVDVAQEGVEAHAAMPAGVADDSQMGVVAAPPVGLAMGREPSWRGDGVVPKKGHPAA